MEKFSKRYVSAFHLHIDNRSEQDACERHRLHSAEALDEDLLGATQVKEHYFLKHEVGPTKRHRGPGAVRNNEVWPNLCHNHESVRDRPEGRGNRSEVGLLDLARAEDFVNSHVLGCLPDLKLLAYTKWSMQSLRLPKVVHFCHRPRVTMPDNEVNLPVARRFQRLQHEQHFCGVPATPYDHHYLLVFLQLLGTPDQHGETICSHCCEPIKKQRHALPHNRHC